MAYGLHTIACFPPPHDVTGRQPLLDLILVRIYAFYEVTDRLYGGKYNAGKLRVCCYDTNHASVRLPMFWRVSNRIFFNMCPLAERRML